MKHIQDIAFQEPLAACGAELREVNIDTSNGTVTKHERELLVKETWKSDCDDCRAPLLRHIYSRKRKNKTMCGVKPIAPTVHAAIASDCDYCRAERMIGPVRERGMMVRPEPNYVPEPMTEMESLDEIRRRRDGQ